MNERDVRLKLTAKAVTLQLQLIESDEDLTTLVFAEPNLREGLVETPMRVAKAMEHWFSGYGKDAGEILKVFEDGASGYDQLVVVANIPFYSKCEHHMADIFGTVSVGYIPSGQIAGLSKFSRIVDMYARRLQVQERLTTNIADALVTHLSADVAVVVKARHMCMESRGVCQQGHHTVTSSMQGLLRSDPTVRAEFMSLIQL